jgi:hypothetical protein
VTLIARTFLSFVLVLMAACDPGMTIRQADQDAGSAAKVGVAIHVTTDHPFIGETWYEPGVEIENSSDSPITVTSVELAAHRTTFQNKPRRSGTYRLEVPPGRTGTLDIRFDLAEGIQKNLSRTRRVAGVLPNWQQAANCSHEPNRRPPRHFRSLISKVGSDAWLT